MIVRALFTLIMIFLVYQLYQRLFLKKRCIACGKMIFREAAICHHCNTVQEGVELVQVGTIQTVSTEQKDRKPGGRQAMILLIGAISLIVSGVALAIWFMQFR